MSAPQESQVEQARRQINKLADEIAQLSEMELGPAEYYTEFLQRLLTALQAPAGAVWTRTPQGNLVLQCQGNMREVGVDRTPEDKAMHEELLRESATQARANIVPPHSSRAGPNGQQGAGNPTPYVILLAPILYEKEVVGLVEVWQDPQRPEAAQRGFLQFMIRMAGLASNYTRGHRLRQMSGQQQLWVQLETFSRQIHASLNPTEVSYWVANEGRRLVETDRISVGVRTGRKCTVQAISGADVVEKRSNLVRLMRGLMDAVIEWGEKLVYAGTKDDALPPAVLHALDLFLAESASKVLIVLPLNDERDKDTKKKARSVLLMESFETNATPEQLLARLEVVGRHAESALYNAVEYRRIPMRFIWMPLAYLQDGMGGKAKAITSLVLAASVALILSMIFVPYPLRMEANGQLLPKQRAWVYAPWPGQVLEIKQNLASNTRVYKDQELVELFDPSLHKMVLELKTEIANADARIASTVAQGPGAESADRNNALLESRSSETVKRAKQDELDKLQQLNNARPMQPGRFSLRAPMNGIILSSDFREQLVGRKVQPHEPLIRIGYIDPKNPKLSDWEIELKVPQKHIGQVLQAFQVQNGKPAVAELDVDLLLTAYPTRTFRGKLRYDKVASQANPNKDAHDEPEPVVLAWVRVHGDDISADSRIPTNLLLTGTEVHSRIRCGDAPMGYSLFYGVWEFLYEKVIFPLT